MWGLTHPHCRSFWLMFVCFCVCSAFPAAAGQDKATERSSCRLATATIDGVVVDYALYPLPDYAANWSQWGKGVVAVNGKVYSAVGDHKGPEGNSFIYEYDPGSKTLRIVADLQTAVPLAPGEYGFGKVHGRLSEGRDGMVYFASFYGTHEPEYFGASHHFFKYDPYTHRIEDLGAMRGLGVPSTAMWSDGLLLYGEATNIAMDRVQFTVFDVTRRQVVCKYDRPFPYARAMFVDREGNAYFNDGGGALKKFDPRGMALHDMPYTMPEAELRQTAGPGPNGYLYGLTQVSHILFRLDPTSGLITRIGSLEGDTAAMELDPTGRYIYYVAQNESGTGATALYQVDVSNPLEPRKRALCDLVPQLEKALGRKYDKSFNLTVSRDGRRVYIGFNAGGCVVFVVAHVPDDGKTVFPAPASAPALRFSALRDVSPAVSRQAQRQITARALADLNGDGYLDIVLGSSNGITLCLWDPKANRFWDHAVEQVGLPEGAVVDIFASDLDNDGDTDLAALIQGAQNDGESRSLVILIQSQTSGDDDGGQTAWEVGFHHRALACERILAFDYNGDGFPDLHGLGGSAALGGDRRLFYNAGDGHFATGDAALETSEPSFTSDGIASDFNGDTWPDLYLPQIGRVLFGSPKKDHAFTEGTSVTLQSTDVFCVGDIDNDGDLDLVVDRPHGLANAQSGAGSTVLLYEGVAGGDERSLPWRDDPTILADLPFVAAVLQVVDLDNDGRQDILLGCSVGPEGGFEPCILANNSGRQRGLSFRVWPDSQQHLGSLLPALAADHNRDGKQDIWCFDDTVACGFAILENAGAADKGLTAVLSLAPRLVGSTGVGSAVRFYEPGKGGDRRYLLGTRRISAKGAGCIGATAETGFAAPGRPFVDIELSPACGGPVSVLPVVPVGTALAVSGSGAYPIRSTVGPANVSRELTSWKQRTLADVKGRFLKVAGAHAGEPGMREFLNRLVVVDRLSEQLAHQMSKLTDVSTRQLLGSGLQQSIGSEAESLGTIRYFLSTYGREFATAVSPPQISQEDLEILREYYSKNLQAVALYIADQGRIPALTRSGLAGGVQLALVMPLLHVPDEAWNTQIASDMPRWFLTPEGLRLAEQCTLDCDRYRTAHVFACMRANTGGKQGIEGPSYVDYLKHVAAARMNAGVPARAITVLHLAIAEARRGSENKSLEGLMLSLCQAGVRAKYFDLEVNWCHEFLEAFPASEHWGKVAVFKLKALHGTGRLDELISQAETYDADPRCEPYRPSVLYLCWVGLRQSGNQAGAERVAEQFLEEFPLNALAADIHFAKAMEALASGDYPRASRLLELVEDRFPGCRVVDRAKQIRSRLERAGVVRP